MARLMVALGAALALPAVAGPLGGTDQAQGTYEFVDVAGEMEAQAPGHGAGVAWGDYDGDGDEDLYVVNLGSGGAGEANKLLRNDGDRFVDVSQEAGVADAGPGVGAAWADVDNDGLLEASDLDLFVSNRPGNNGLFVNDGAGSFANLSGDAGVTDYYGMGEGLAWFDGNRDGLVDLYVANYTGATGARRPNRLYQALGDGTFAEVAEELGAADVGNGEGVAIADYDSDGRPDIFVANAGGRDALLNARPDGTYSDVALQLGVDGGSGSSFGVAWADYDNDGWLDLYVARQGANSLYRNLGEGAGFEDVAADVGVGGSQWSLGCSWADYDNDGFIDLYVANAAQGGFLPADVLYRNMGGTADSGPVFADVTDSAGIANVLDARGTAWADYDGDGDLDLYVVNQGLGEPNRLYQNGGGPNHWLHVELAGTSSNRSAIGARVTVTTDMTQVREVSGGSGFASQDSLTLEFGLGEWSEGVDVQITWPNGGTTPLENVAVDQVLMVEEPAWPELTYLPLALRSASPATDQ